VALFSSVALVQATPIFYMETGIASGMIGGSPFTNALVQVTMTGDTANVVQITGECSTFCFADPISLATVTIEGVGTATVTDPTEAFVIGTPVSISTGYPVLPYIVLGTVDHPPALDSFTGIAFQGDNALLNYDLQSSIGPITGSPGGFGSPCCVVHTNLGDLSFSPTGSPTSSGTFAATVIPEPSSLFLMGAGITVLAGLTMAQSRRYRRRIKDIIRPA
jgi:hypothetical protein